MHMATSFVRVGLLGLGLVFAGAGMAVADGDADAEKAAKEKAAAEEAAKAAEAKDKIKAFQSTAKAAKEPGQIIDAIKELATCKHKSVVGALAGLLRFPDGAVAGEAARAIGEIGAGLAGKDRLVAVFALTPILAMDRTRPDVAIAAIKGLVTVGDIAALPSLFKYLDSKENGVASASITACGAIKHESCIDPLVKALIKVDFAPSGAGGNAWASSGGNGAGASPGPEAQARITAIMDPCLKSLNALTGQSFQRATEWKNWWRSNRATFKIEQPEPEKAETPAK